MLIGLSIIFLIKFVPKPKVSGKNNPVIPHIIPAIIGSKYTGIFLELEAFLLNLSYISVANKSC